MPANTEFGEGEQSAGNTPLAITSPIFPGTDRQDGMFAKSKMA